MGLDISSKSGLSFSIGYGAFTFMRQEILNMIKPGLGQIHEWATLPFGFQLTGIQYEWSKDGRKKYDLMFGVTADEFAATCSDLMETFLRRNNFKALWEVLILHSDCDGKITPGQCSRLVKDLDRLDPKLVKIGSDVAKFRELVREAAKRNETLYFH